MRSSMTSTSMARIPVRPIWFSLGASLAGRVRLGGFGTRLMPLGSARVLFLLEPEHPTSLLFTTLVLWLSPLADQISFASLTALGARADWPSSPPDCRASIFRV